MHGAPHWQVTPYTIPLGVGAGLFVILAVYLLRRQTERRLVPGATLGALLLLASGFWMGLYALELSRTDFAAKVLLNQLAYLGVAPLPLLWLAYVLRHAGLDSLPREAWAALGTVPVVTVGLVFTNRWHNLIWDGLLLTEHDGYVVLVNDHGIAFVGFVVYAYILVVVALAVLVRTLSHADGIYRKQTVGLLVGGLAPAVGGLVYVAGASPVPGLNLPALAFALTASAVAWSVFRHRLFTVVPIAWESAVESMQGAAIVLDDERLVLDANPSSESVLDRSLVDSYGRPVESVLKPELVAAIDDAPNAEVSVTIGGDDRDLLVNTTPLGDDTATSGTLVLVRDITERKERERRLERQNDRLEEFASVVSHDLRNPLTVARGYLELARETNDDDYFTRVEDAHDRMETIIDDLLTLARQGETLTDRSPVALSTVASEAWDSVAVGEATFDARIDQTVDADRGRLRQLFENLFRNSVEHGSAGSQARPDDAVEHGTTETHDSSDDAVSVVVGPITGGFYVEDDGPGIPESESEDVFERGYTTHEDGTGFGLPIVKSVADAHGWTVTLTSSSSGGARFEFTDVETGAVEERTDSSGN
ncbi:MULTISPECIES: histidine kinase N-terminal 7TM domain-containing protein [Haloferax]|uniref:histidine kinase n=1 Tax=Haloferax marinum TaxID=2666143 RepID=A0A6A8GA44_9EURY|nr:MULTISPECIES: histidine kinase N-terminal 7TM domain-containing protein [Haloferax]KAB1198354.1 PAS domain-containing protein [Haloferax sp. CBA1150]MRW97452.1 PAS domain-containing protein [Haloferax marinum]